MEQLLKKISTYVKKLSLSSEEKSAIKSVLISRMTQSEKTANAEQIKVMMDVGWFSLFSQRSYRLVAASLVVVLSFGGSLAFAAEKSVPGDFLYPIKTNINENIARSFQKSSSVKVAAFETKILDRRLAEAEELNVQNKLSGKLAEKVKKEVLVQKEKTRSEVENLAKSKMFEDVGREDEDQKERGRADDSQANQTTTETSRSLMSESVEERVVTSGFGIPENSDKKSGKTKTESKKGRISEDDEREATDNFQKVLTKHKKIIKVLDLGNGDEDRNGDD